MLRIEVEENARGLLFRQGRKRCPLVWPEGAWTKLPARFRDVLADNLAHVLTVDLPFASGSNSIAINRARPCFWAQFRTVVLGSIPQAVEGSRLSTSAALQRFRAAEYRFDSDIPAIPHGKRWETKPRAVVLVSPDPLSLASLGLAREMGLDPVAVCVDDLASARESKASLARIETLRGIGFTTSLVTNGVEQLAGKGLRGRLGRMHRVTGLALIALPIAHAFHARYIVLGNEQDANWPFTNKDGFLTYPAFDRTSSWTMQIDMMTRTLSGGAVGTTSLIEPLTSLAAAKLLEERYPGLNELVVSGRGSGAQALHVRKQELAAKSRTLHSPGTVPVELREKLMRILTNAVAEK